MKVITKKIQLVPIDPNLWNKMLGEYTLQSLPHTGLMALVGPEKNVVAVSLINSRVVSGTEIISQATFLVREDNGS